MKITIIIPYKNEAEYIGLCADSLRRQDGDFEFIFVNDNSSDDPVFETDDRFALVDNKHKPGVSGARNTGLDIASGDWISFLDADDELLPNAYKTFCSELEREPDADVHQFNSKRYYSTLNKTVVKYANQAGRYEMPKPPELWFGVWNKLFRAEFLKDIRFDEGIQFGEDGLFVLECFARGAFIQCAEYSSITVLHKFVNKESLSHQKTTADILKQVRKYIGFLKSHKDPELRWFLCEELSRIFDSKHIKKLISEGR